MKSFSWLMPLKIFFLGFLLMFFGVVLVMIAGFVSGGSVGFVWVLPFPSIVLGAGWPYLSWAIILAVALTALGIVLFILFRIRARKTKVEL